MPNSGKTGDNRKKRPSGQENNTVIVGLEVYEKIKDEVLNVYEMNAKGRLAKAVKFDEYITIKAYNNQELKKTPEVSIKNKESKESDGRGH